jgi:glucan-binding YG repeat protein
MFDGGIAEVHLTITGTSNALTITGPTGLSLDVGYKARSTGMYAYTVYNPLAGTAPMVTQDNTHGGKITWNNITQKLDIAAGLKAGTYDVTLTVADGTAPNGTITFKLTVRDIPQNTANTNKPGWKKQDAGWIYYDEGGKTVANRWKKVDGKWYYFNANGAMQTGWLKQGGTWYWLRGSGAMATGWANVNGAWYYLKQSGAMATGWLQQGNTWYYLKPGGAMATGEYTVGGKVNQFSASGAWRGTK